MKPKLKPVLALLPEVSLQNQVRESVLRVHLAQQGQLRWAYRSPAGRG